jgi:PAS domain S-box-containing protein
MKSSAKCKILTVVLVAGVFPWLVSLAAHLVYGETPRPQEPLHEWFELAGSGIALGVAMLLLLRLRHESAPPHLLWVAAALVTMGLADGMHGVAHSEPEWSWLRHGATLLGGGLFAMVWVPLPAVMLRTKRVVMLLVTVLALAGFVAAWRWADWLPAPVLADGYSPSAKAATVLGGLGFLAAALFFFRRCRREPRTEDLVFASYTLIFGSSSLMFPFVHVWAADWWSWHTVRLLAHAVLIASAYGMVDALYHQIARHAQSLEASVRERTAELQDRNARLTAEIAERREAEERSRRFAAELQAANASLLESRRAALNLMDDALVARQRAEAASAELLAQVAERQRAQAALGAAHAEVVKERNRLAAVMEALPVGVAILDARGRLALGNPAFDRVWGGPRPSVPEASDPAACQARWADTGKPLQPGEWASTRAVQQGEAVIGQELRIQRLDGTCAFVLNSAVPIRDATGGLIGSAVVIQDITARKAAEDALRQSESFYRQTLESIPGMVFTTRPDGYCDYQSQQWVDYTGVPMSDHLGDGWNRLLHPEDQPRALAAWRAAVEGHAPYDLEYRVRRHDGSYEWFKVIGRPIRGAEDQIVRWFGVAMNIEALQRAEEALRRAHDELERRVRDRTAELLAANTALREEMTRRKSLEARIVEVSEREQRRIGQDLHDGLCQQLTGLGYLCNASCREVARVAPKEAESLRRIVEMLGQTIHQAHGLARGLHPVGLEADSLMLALNQLVTEFKAMYGVAIHFSCETPVFVEDNATAANLYRIAQEALSNALKHSQCSEIVVELAANAQGRWLSISDNGRGLPAEAPHGNGLGLETMRFRARSIGAQLKVEPNPRGGTTVLCLLPHKRNQHPPKAKPRKNSP